MSCFDSTFEAESNSLMCEPCGEYVQIPVKLRDNVGKLKANTKTVWITCDEHKGHIAMYYRHENKRLACWDCFVKNGWPTNKMTLVNPDSVEEYCERILQVIVELRQKAQECSENITSYRDKTVTFTSSQFLDMTNEIYEFLSPLAGTAEAKALIDFHNVPGKLPEEPKVILPPIDDNPLKFEAYSLKTFCLNLPE